MNVSGNATIKQAPCGRVVSAEAYEDQDEDVVITREVQFACGCLSIQHEYHDGSVSLTVTHHDGTVLVDELDSAE